MKKQRQQGISLLEILLVVLIAAAVVAGSINYYSQTLRNTRVSEAANFLQQINKAGYEWLQILGADEQHPAQYPGDFSGLGNTGLARFLKYQLISCPKDNCSQNPWGGTNTVSTGTNPKYMLITLSGIGKADCALLQQQMQNIVPQGLSQQNYCENSDGNTAKYSVNL